MSHLLWIVPPMGASAVLVFAVPASPMAQPWAAIGGNVVSSLIGVIVAHNMPLPALSAGIVVASAIGAMSLLRCLHPPGGAAALVGLNAVVLVASAWLFHRVLGHAYPHVPAPQAPGPKDMPWTFNRSDMAAALEEIGETFDIDAEDLGGLLRRIEQRALARTYHGLSCADLMTAGASRSGRTRLPRRRGRCWWRTMCGASRSPGRMGASWGWSGCANWRGPPLMSPRSCRGPRRPGPPRPPSSCWTASRGIASMRCS